MDIKNEKNYGEKEKIENKVKDVYKEIENKDIKKSSNYKDRRYFTY